MNWIETKTSEAGYFYDNIPTGSTHSDVYDLHSADSSKMSFFFFQNVQRGGGSI